MELIRRSTWGNRARLTELSCESSSHERSRLIRNKSLIEGKKFVLQLEISFS